MSYVSENRRASPVGMSAAVLINGSIILAVALSPLVVEPRLPGPITMGDNIEVKPAPPPHKPEEKQQAKPLDPIFVPKTPFKPLDPPVGPTTTSETTGSGPVLDGQGGDDMAEIVPDVIKPLLPIFKAAQRHPGFARSFQPDYPMGLLKLEIEGSATVRVLIGTDGRVRQVQILRASEPEFGKATERQALKSWRFKPATRDGRPVEDWQTLTVRFDIN